MSKRDVANHPMGHVRVVQYAMQVPHLLPRPRIGLERWTQRIACMHTNGGSVYGLARCMPRLCAAGRTMVGVAGGSGNMMVGVAGGSGNTTRTLSFPPRQIRDARLCLHVLWRSCEAMHMVWSPKCRYLQKGCVWLALLGLQRPGCQELHRMWPQMWPAQSWSLWSPCVLGRFPCPERVGCCGHPVEFRVLFPPSLCMGGGACGCYFLESA